MAMFYYRLVNAGKLKLEDVPEKWREAVRELMEKENE